MKRYASCLARGLALGAVASWAAVLASPAQAAMAGLAKAARILARHDATAPSARQEAERFMFLSHSF